MTEEVGQALVGVVELVVTEREHVEACLVQERSICLAFEEAEEEGAGYGITRMDFDHFTARRGGEFVDLCNDTWEAPELHSGFSTRKLKISRVGFEVAVGVVHMEDREIERRASRSVLFFNYLLNRWRLRIYRVGRIVIDCAVIFWSCIGSSPNRIPSVIDYVVVTRPRPERVAASISFEQVVSCFAEDDVVTGSTAQNVVTVSAEQRVGTLAALDVVVVVAALDAVVASASNEDVISSVTTDDVVASSSIDGIISERPNDHVVTVGSDRQKTRALDDDRRFCASAGHRFFGRYHRRRDDDSAYQGKRKARSFQSHWSPTFRPNFGRSCILLVTRVRVQCL